ncbi:M48 family metalloprotease [Pseudanabaena sp. FACHB-2040]|nr:M48 family metalloprotease [Pseudanabaena sp. FACHB-2040]
MLSHLTNSIQKYQRRWLYGLMSLLMAVSISLATPTPSHAGILDLIFNGVQYIQLSNLSDQNEVTLGRQIDQQIKRQGVRVYNRNPAIVDYVNQIGQRLATTSDRPNLPYTVQVLEDNSVNASATMGGFLYVNTGLIRTAANEAELAGVMAHEIGHITGRHAVNQMRERAIASGIAGAIGVNRDRLVNIGVQLALQMPNQRADEYDADRRGFANMGRAGYDQSGFVTFMQRLNNQSGRPPEFFSTHPDPSNRVTSLQNLLNAERNPAATAGLDANAYKARISGL